MLAFLARATATPALTRQPVFLVLTMCSSPLLGVSAMMFARLIAQSSPSSQISVLNVPLTHSSTLQALLSVPRAYLRVVLAPISRHAPHAHLPS
jgi:hypothetical protein